MRPHLLWLLCPRLGGIKRSSASVVHPSVCLMSRTSALTRKPKGLGRRNFAQGYPRSHATPTLTSRSKVKVTGRGHIVAATLFAVKTMGHIPQNLECGHQLRSIWPYIFLLIFTVTDLKWSLSFSLRISSYYFAEETHVHGLLISASIREKCRLRIFHACHRQTDL